MIILAIITAIWAPGYWKLLALGMLLLGGCSRQHRN